MTGPAPAREQACRHHLRVLAATFGTHWWWLAGLGLIHSGVCHVLMYSAYPRLPVGTLAVVAFVYPGVALLLDYVLYGQALGLLQGAGLALIVVGTLGVNLKWRLSRTRENASAANAGSGSGNIGPQGRAAA